MMLFFALLLAAERGMHFTVTDASGRSVTGLDKSAFTVRENGFIRECLEVANPESAITVVVLTDGSVQSLDEARKRLSGSTSPRKVSIIATNASAPADLGHMLILYRSDSESAMDAA